MRDNEYSFFVKCLYEVVFVFLFYDVVILELIEDINLSNLFYFKIINVVVINFYVIGYFGGKKLEYDLLCKIIKD